MTDRVLAAFLDGQREAGLALAASSDLVELLPLEPEPPQRYLVRFGCTGLVTSDTNEVQEATGALVGIWLADDYLRHVDPWTVVTWLEPRRVFHPNVRAPFACLGRIVPGTPLVDLIYRCFELITWSRVTMREDDALNRDACAWARRNGHRFPVDRRALRREAAAAFDIELVEVS